MHDYTNSILILWLQVVRAGLFKKINYSSLFWKNYCSIKGVDTKINIIEFEGRAEMKWNRNIEPQGKVRPSVNKWNEKAPVKKTHFHKIKRALTTPEMS